MATNEDLTDRPIDPARVPVHETVGIFDDHETLQKAIDNLHLAGFDRFELSLLDREALDGNASSEQLANDPTTPRRPYVAPESVGDAQGGLIAGFTLLPAMGAAAVAAGTSATVAATAATGGVGALIGGALAWIVARRHRRSLDEAKDRDELLLWIRTRSKEHRHRAEEILERHAAHHINSYK